MTGAVSRMSLAGFAGSRSGDGADQKFNGYGPLVGQRNEFRLTRDLVEAVILPVVFRLLDSLA